MSKRTCHNHRNRSSRFLRFPIRRNIYWNTYYNSYRNITCSGNQSSPYSYERTFVENCFTSCTPCRGASTFKFIPEIDFITAEFSRKVLEVLSVNWTDSYQQSCVGSRATVHMIRLPLWHFSCLSLDAGMFHKWGDTLLQEAKHISGKLHRTPRIFLCQLQVYVPTIRHKCSKTADPGDYFGMPMSNRKCHHHRNRSSRFLELPISRNI